jgi:YHS domain-containing protein
VAHQVDRQVQECIDRCQSCEHIMGGLKYIGIGLAVALALCAVEPAFGQQHPTHDTASPDQPSTQKPGQVHEDEPRDAQAPHDEHAGMMMTGALGISKARVGSGTSWLPDFTPMFAVHRQFGDWTAMLHQNLFIQYIDENTNRGDSQFGSVNWVMGMAERRLRGGHFGVRTMLSVEPWTVGACGYPDLLATGESCKGRPLHDRQHPHDLFMEAAVLYERELNRRVAFQLYGALAGEPALGPVAFPHRISALSTPMAPLTHHWLDSTHISYGVLTGGIFGRRWKAEASAFNGREPDENRFDLDLAPLDSFAGRLWLAPSDRVSLQVSRGRLKEAEVPPFGGPRRDVNRTTASFTYHQLVGTGGLWAVTGAWGRNSEEDHATDAVVLETDIGLDDRNTLFARVEGAEKSGEDLVIPELGDQIVGVSKLHVGYRRRMVGGMFEPHVGAALSFSGIPNQVERAYGRGSGFGVTVFLSLRPSAMPGMPGMRRTASTPGPGTAVPEAAVTKPAETGAIATPEPHAGHAGAATSPGSPVAGSAATRPAEPGTPGTATEPHAGHAAAATSTPSAGTIGPEAGATKPPESGTTVTAEPHAGHAGAATSAPSAAAAVAARPAERGTTGTAKPHAGHAEAATASSRRGSAPRTPAPAAQAATRSGATLAIDPVDGLKVDASTAPQATFQDQTYYFCTEQHRELFLKNPARFLPRELERRQ